MDAGDFESRRTAIEQDKRERGYSQRNFFLYKNSPSLKKDLITAKQLEEKENQSNYSEREKNAGKLSTDENLVKMREEFLQKFGQQTTKADKEATLEDLHNLYARQRIEAKRLFLLKGGESQTPEQGKQNRENYLKRLDCLEERYRKAGVLNDKTLPELRKLFGRYQQDLLRKGITTVRSMGRYFP